MDHEIIAQASYLEKKSEELGGHLEYVDSEISELEKFDLSLKSLLDSNSKNILASLGKGVHIPAEIKSSNLFVEVGSGIVIRKTPEQAKKVVESQIKKLKEARVHILSELDSTRTQFQELIEKYQASKS